MSVLGIMELCSGSAGWDGCDEYGRRIDGGGDDAVHFSRGERIRLGGTRSN
jgi:hypothetical protein